MSANGSSAIMQHREKIIITLQECIERLMQTPEPELPAYMREQNAALIDWLDDENRLLAALAGEKVEPKQHVAHAILLPSFGGGS